MNTRVLALAIAMTLAGSVAGAARAGGEAPTRVSAGAKSPALDHDRAQVLAWTRDLEVAPLAADAGEKRAWLMQWIKDVRGLKVHVCDVFGVLGQENRQVGSLLLQQYMFASAGYLIEHPTLDGREMAVQLAGVASAMNAYAVLRKQDPLQRSAHFDELLKLQGKGELPEYVESNVFAKCNNR